MKEYIIIQANNLQGLIDQVTKEMKQGYTPCGNVSCMVDYYRKETYIQAMTK
ncbi:DUF1737 domain-containing protein [Loigolactobacillus coryniformis]|uniref:DUF1737 domain-containing protein n=1 Tax=Loigolactobacillus coryniformis TaxID=1610 RepID=UPI00387E3C38